MSSPRNWLRVSSAGNAVVDIALLDAIRVGDDFSFSALAGETYGETIAKAKRSVAKQIWTDFMHGNFLTSYILLVKITDLGGDAIYTVSDIPPLVSWEPKDSNWDHTLPFLREDH